MVRRYEDRRHNIDQPILPPERAFFNAKSCVTGIKPISTNFKLQQKHLTKRWFLNLAAEQPPKLAVDPKKNSPLKQLTLYRPS